MKKAESQLVRDEEGRLLRDKGCIYERWMRFFHSLLNGKSDMLDPGIPKMLPQQPVASALRIEPTGEEIVTAMKAIKTMGPDGLSVESGTRTSTRPNHPAGAPPTYHPYLARGESPTAVERRGHYRTSLKGWQDRGQKLPWHLARVKLW